MRFDGLFCCPRGSAATVRRFNDALVRSLNAFGRTCIPWRATMKKVKSGAGNVTRYMIFAATMTGGLFADTPQSSYQLPSTAQVIAYLLQSVNWYRHAYAERQVASDPADLLFLHDNQAIEEQITRLSFDFAKADAAMVATTSSLYTAPMTPRANDPPSSALAHFIELKSRNDQARQEAIQEVDTLKRRIAAAGKSERQRKVALDDVQSRSELLQAVSQTVDGLIEFVQSAGMDQSRNGNFEVTIEDLAQSVPELNSPSAPLTKLPVLDASSGTTPSGRAYTVLRLASEVSALDRKLRVIAVRAQAAASGNLPGVAPVGAVGKTLLHDQFPA
jgi:hypothetical protein